jgi:tetratricopeptide (TPR) repeat protein
LIRLSLLCLAALSLSSCSLATRWYRSHQVESALQAQNFTLALQLLQTTIRENPDTPLALNAARQGAQVAQVEAKDYPSAIGFYRAVILLSANSTERKQAQRAIAQIEYENLQNCAQAVLDFERLLHLDNSPEEVFQVRLSLAKSQLRLNNVEQALAEIDLLLSQPHVPEQQVFEAKVLKANTLVADRQMSAAASLWEDIMREFPDKSKKENVALNLVVCYEEMKEFTKAIGVLEKMRDGYAHPDFLDLRIQRLKERAHNQPGAQGLKR